MSANATGPAAISLADEEAVKQVVIDSVMGLWSVVNNLTRLRPTRHDLGQNAEAGMLDYPTTRKPRSWANSSLHWLSS